MPRLLVLGGPNGAGKTTYFDASVSAGLISAELPYINVDNIARFELRSYSEVAMEQAKAIARERMSIAIKQGHDFAVENNLAKQSDYDWIERMRRAGYSTELHFISTDSIEKHVGRVMRRVAEGGHSVPPHIIEQRYRMAETYLKSHFHFFDEAVLIDNSDVAPLIVARLEGMSLTFLNADTPAWVLRVLSLVLRMNARKGSAG